MDFFSHPESPLHKHHDFYFVLAIFALFFGGDVMWSQTQEIITLQDAAIVNVSGYNPRSEAREVIMLDREIVQAESESDLELQAISQEIDPQASPTPSPTPSIE
jgi:hypothetical protein